MSGARLSLPEHGVEDAEGGLRGAFAATMRSLHLSQGGDPEDADTLAEAASLVVEMLQQGASSADLAVLPAPESARLLAALARSPLVIAGARESGRHPLVLNGGALYLARYWRYERVLAQRLSELNREVACEDAARVAAELRRLFPAPTTGAVDWQAVAAATAVLRQLCVISGGPGTGKTSTVARILVLLVILHPEIRIALAAPTGKAAARVQESIRHQLRELDLPEQLRVKLAADPFTVHRLLGARPGTSVLTHGPKRRLPYDVVVVDEASMLDLALASKLVAALPDHARLVLLGDKDQLSSVEAGAVYAEVSAERAVTPAWAARVSEVTGSQVPASATRHPLQDAVVWFERSYRVSEDSPLRQLARAVNENDSARVQHLRTHGGGAIESMERLPEPAVLAELLIERYVPYIQALRDGADERAIFAAFNRFRVLCAARQGRYGATHLDRLLVECLRSRLGHPAGRETWFPGRPVMVTQNDHAFRLYNGDTGITLANPEGGVSVRFETGEGPLRRIAPSRLPGPAGALAITVHRAQGSEFQSAAFVADAGSARVLSRALFYTAVTRARESVLLCAEPGLFSRETLAAAVARTALWSTPT